MTKFASYAITWMGAGFLILVLYLGLRFVPGFALAMAIAELAFVCIGAVLLSGLGAWTLIVKDRQTEKPLLSNLLVGVFCLGLGIFVGFQAFDIWEKRQDSFVSLLELLDYER